MRPTTPATSAAHWHSSDRTTDGTRDRAQQGLPATVLITVPSADTHTALCYLTPVPRTKQRGRSSPCPCSLGNSRKAQLLVLHLVRDPRQGLGRTFPSPLRPRPGSSRILVDSASAAPLASRPIRVSAPGHTYYDSHDGQGTATGAMGRRSNLLFTIPY